LKTLIRTCLSLVILLFAFNNAKAQITCTWVGGTSGNWNNSANWNITGFGTNFSYPGNLEANDAVVINGSAAISVAALPQGSIYSLSIANGATVTLTFASGMTLKVTNSVTVGTTSAATLNFDGPGDVTGTSAITLNTNSTLTSNSTCSINAASLTMASGTTATLNGGTTLTGAITVNGTATIAGSLTTSAASMALNSSNTLTENGNITLSGACTIANAVTPTVTVGSSYTLTVGGGLTVGNYSVSGLTFAGSGTESISGSSTFYQYSTLVVNSGNTLNFNASSSISFANYCSLTNGGTVTGATCAFTLNGTNDYISNSGAFTFTGGSVNLTSGSSGAYITNSGTFTIASSCTLTIGNTSESFTNTSITSTFSATSSTVNMSGSMAYFANNGILKATSTTFTFGNDNYIKIFNVTPATATQPSGTFKTCTFTMNTSGSYILNLGTWTDHGSTYTVEGQSSYLSNGAAAGANPAVTTSSMTLNGSTINFTSGGGNGQYVTNFATLVADSTTNITCANYQSYVTNSNTFTAGLSNSSCIITLSAQGAYVSNTGAGIFVLGSTSIIYPSGYQASITNNSTAANSFTLMSDAYGSAAIGPIGTSGSVGGTASYTVQRYYQGSTTYNNTTKRWIERDYRIISSPVYNTTYSGNNVFGLNYIVGTTAGQTTGANSASNAFITGCTGGSTSAGNPSVYVYRESITPSNHTFTSGNFLGITNITSSTSTGTITCSDGNTYSLPVGTGVFFFFRGAATQWTSRTANPFIAPENVILTNSGTINTFNITVKDWYSPGSSYLGYTGTGTGTNYAVRGYNMVGNPYPCTIDWCTAYSGTGITRTNINPTIYEFDPVNKQYDAFLATSSSGGTATGNGSRYVMSGEGFVVQANAANPQLIFTENAKAPTQLSTGGTLLMARRIAALAPSPQTPGSQVMRLKLSVDSVNYDDIALIFNSSASANYSATEDAPYIAGNGAAEGLSSFSDDSVKLAINSFPLPGLKPYVVRLSVAAAYTGTFTFQRTQLDAIPKLYDIWLMDKLKKDSLDIKNNTTYVFDVNEADTTTYGDNRFELVFRQDPALMVHLLSFSAVKASGGSQVAWTTENEENYTTFTLQRSTDGGTTFTTLEGLTSSGIGKYGYLDENPVTGANSYRLQITDLNGTISYSSVITIMYSNTSNTITASNISVYPNPASTTLNLAIKQTNTVTVTSQSPLQTSSITSGQTLAATNSSGYNITIVNMTGSVVRTASTTQPTWQQSVSDLSPGTYVIKVINGSNNSLVGSSTFIKL